MCLIWWSHVYPWVETMQHTRGHTGERSRCEAARGNRRGALGPDHTEHHEGHQGETRGYKWVHFNQKKYLSYCRSLLQHLILCLRSFFPECRVKRQSNPCWLDHNHMWPALVWSLSIGSSFMSMSTAFKKLQASN